jgi:23S rRNA pseudouridine1911/1915/1917 synthase
VIVVNKPSGLLTHAKGGLSDEPTVAEIIRPKTSFATDTDRPGIVHRLDRDTSGLLIIAKNPESAAHLQRQFAERTAKKIYIAITDGKPKLNAAKIDLPIGRNPSDIYKSSGKNFLNSSGIAASKTFLSPDGKVISNF